MTDTTTDKPKPRQRKPREPVLRVEPISVEAEVAAGMIGVSVRTFQRIVARGQVKGRQVTDGRVVYPVDELRAFVAGLPKVGQQMGQA